MAFPKFEEPSRVSRLSAASLVEVITAASLLDWRTFDATPCCTALAKMPLKELHVAGQGDLALGLALAVVYMQTAVGARLLLPVLLRHFRGLVGGQQKLAGIQRRVMLLGLCAAFGVPRRLVSKAIDGVSSSIVVLLGLCIGIGLRATHLLRVAGKHGIWRTCAWCRRSTRSLRSQRFPRPPSTASKTFSSGKAFGGLESSDRRHPAGGRDAWEPDSSRFHLEASRSPSKLRTAPGGGHLEPAGGGARLGAPAEPLRARVPQGAAAVDVESPRSRGWTS